MSNSNLTKQLLANTLKDLMQKIPLNKITVQDIVDVCGLNRKTFYYHFKDKQELICWIFDSEFAKIEYLNDNNSIIEKLSEHLYANRNFYVAAITSDVQNNLRDHLFSVAYSSIEKKVITFAGSRKISPDIVKLISDYFSNAVIGMLTKWAKEGMRTLPIKYISDFNPITNDCLKYVVEKYVDIKDVK